jgi:hypothetical protein
MLWAQNGIDALGLILYHLLSVGPIVTLQYFVYLLIVYICYCTTQRRSQGLEMGVCVQWRG